MGPRCFHCKCYINSDIDGAPCAAYCMPCYDLLFKKKTTA